jgi:hypothetical protein
MVNLEMLRNGLLPKSSQRLHDDFVIDFGPDELRI